MKNNQSSVSFLTKLFVSYFSMLIIISIFFYLKQILLLLEVLLVNKPSAKNMFVLLTSPLPSVFLISCPFAICIGISLGALIIKDIKTQIIEKTRGSFIQIMLIGLIVSLTCIYVSGYIIPDSNISFNNAYRSALLNDDDIVFEGINNTPREMTMTQLMQEINLLQMKGQEDNRLLNIYKYEFQKNIAFSLSSLFFSFFSFSLVFNIRKHMYIALVISVIVYPIYYFLLEYIQLNFIKTGYAHYIVWIPNMILIFVSFSVNFINYFKKNQHNIKHL